MSVEMIKQRLLDYHCQTVIDQENALKEIIQEIALMTLSQAGFFRQAAFQGGTCLRILYGLNRFSEDLDFILEEPDKDFDWQIYLKNLEETFEAYGYSLEIGDRKKTDNNVKNIWLKADSIGNFLVIKDVRDSAPKLRIKLEIDINPPQGSKFELKYLDFPLSFGIRTQDLSSLFASKSHALLCREYIKGRDWYDFVWYVSRNTPVNFSLLTNALNQAGPWQGQKVSVTPEWYLENLKDKIKSIDWQVAKNDVQRFLRPQELPTLDVWSKDFFLSRVDKLASVLNFNNIKK